MITVYVAGSSKERVRARLAMDRVEQAGLVLTCDWLKMMEQAGPDHLLPFEAKLAAASDDLFAVGYARVLWFLLPQTVSTGAWFELGYFCRALTDSGADRRIVVSGASANDPLFVVWAVGHGAERYQTDDEAAVALGLLPATIPTTTEGGGVTGGGL